MGPRPYSGRSVLPSDSSNSSTSVESDTAQITVDTSPGSLSTTTTPSPTNQPPDSLWDVNNFVTDAHDEAIEIDTPNIPFYPTPADSMPFDHALPVFLRVLTNEQNLGNVQTLKLRVISDLVSLQRISLYTMNLRELDLEGSLLYSLRYIGCNLKLLQILKVGNCRLDSLDGTFGLTSLRQLYAQRNLITDVSPCSNLPHIQHIDASGNRIRNIAYAGFLSVCRKLKSIVFTGNPAAQLPDYRSHVRRILPQLESLDGVPFNNAENSSLEKSEGSELSDECFDNEDDDETLEEFKNDFFNNSYDSHSSSESSKVADSRRDDKILSDGHGFEISDMLNGRNSHGGKDLHLLSLRKEKDDGRQFRGTNRNVNIEQTEYLNGENCPASTSNHGGEGDLWITLPRLHLSDKDQKKLPERESFHLSSESRSDVKKGKAAMDGSGESAGDAFEELSPPDSDPEDVQKLQGVHSRIARPETMSAGSTRSDGNVMTSSSASSQKPRKIRPSTAGSPSELEEKTLKKTTYRSLTSGLPMCGNVALALRNRRKQELEKEEVDIGET